MYYNGRVPSSYRIIKNLIKLCQGNCLADSILRNSYAFPGVFGTEIQFFRARLSESGTPYSAKDMSFLPKEKRSLAGTNRFSIPGVPGLYLGNSSYACWVEMGCPAEHDFVVSPVHVNDSIRIFNLAVMSRDLHALGDFDANRVHCWLILLILKIASSYVVTEQGRQFKSEYIVSQAIMLACRELGFQGIAYYSCRVDDNIFSFATINLALYVDMKQNNQKSDLCRYIDISDSYSYQMFKQIDKQAADCPYELRCVKAGVPVKVGNYDQQVSYKYTDFYRFDKFLFFYKKRGNNSYVDRQE